MTLPAPIKYTAKKSGKLNSAKSTRNQTGHTISN